MNSSSSQLPRRVVKLGGSLLDSPGIIDRLNQWLGRQQAAVTYLIVGGGRLADCVREYDKTLGLGETASHWLAIHAMRLNAELVLSLLPEAEFLDAFGDRSLASYSPRLLIVDPLAFMRADTPPTADWETWSTTSDSIAARFASVIRADELVLLKSCLPSSNDPAELARVGYVDPQLFAVLANPLRFVELVSAKASEAVWRPVEITN